MQRKTSNQEDFSDKKNCHSQDVLSSKLSQAFTQETLAFKQWAVYNEVLDPKME